MNEHVQSIDEVRTQLMADVSGLVASAKRAYRLRAALLWTAVSFAVLFALVCVDMLTRREELGLRILFLAAWIGSALAAAYYMLAPAWRFAPSKVELARWIEQAQPELGERLSTAVELAEAELAEPGLQDERLGSQQFRDAAIRRWSSYAPAINWKSYLDHASWLRAAGVLLAAIAVAAIFAAWRPNEVRLAMARLFSPWLSLPWPQNDQLQFVDLPKVIADGFELNLEVVDAMPPLPDDVTLQVRYPDSDAPQDFIAYPTKNLIDVAVGSIPSVDQPIEIRAVGGDDNAMEWHRVDVAQPPKLESFRFQIEPPEYSGRTPTEIVGNRIQVLVGSRVRFIGRVAEPVTQIEVAMQRRGDSNPNAGEEPNPNTAPPVSLAANGRDFEWLVCDASSTVGIESWRWKLTTRSELTIESPELWSVEIVADGAPLVTLAEQELAQLSPDAALQVRGTAVDDLGLVDVSLRWQIEGTEVAEPGRFSLWTVDDQQDSARREFAVDRTWQFDSSVGLLAGQRLLLWMEARDTLGQIGKSSTQTLDVRSAEDVLESIAGRQSQLLDQIRSITEAQRRNSQLASRSREIVEQSDSVRREDVDALNNVSQMQQSVQRQLNADRDSVSESLQSLTTLLENNQLGDSEMAAQLKDLSDRIERIGASQMNAAIRDAQAAREQAKSAADAKSKPDTQLVEKLKASEASQIAALTELQGLTDRLTQSEALRVVERELGQVLNQQQSLRRDTDSLELRRLAGMNKDEFQASRAGLQADQQGLAQTVDQLQRRAKALAESMPKDQAAMRTQVESAIEKMTEDQVSGQMRAATESIANDRFAQASDLQAKAIESLRDALQDLNASSSRNLEGQLGQLKSTATELRALADEQSDLAERMAAPNAQSQTSQLSAEQRRLQQQTEDQQNRSAQLGDNQTEQTLDGASQSQDAAAQSADRGQVAEAAKRASEAAKQLAEAAKNSAERAQELEREVASKQLMQLAAALSQLVKQQSPIVERLDASSQVQLDVLEEDDRKAAEQEIRQLASRQEAVRQMVRDVRERADKLPAFDWTLEQAELDMARAVAAAQRFRVAPEATESATRALRKLEQAASAMKRSEQQPQSAENQQDSQESAEGDSKSKPVPPLASLKLLRGLQSDVNEETKQLSDAGAIMSSDRTQRLEQLSQQQRALGLQLEQILRELAASTDSNQ